LTVLGLGSPLPTPSSAFFVSFFASKYFFPACAFESAANYLLRQKVQGIKMQESKPITPKKNEYQKTNGARLEQVWLKSLLILAPINKQLSWVIIPLGPVI